MFFEDILIDDKPCKAIFDTGSKTKRIIRGTEITNLKPMIICEFILKKGSSVQIQKEMYKVKEVETSACGFFTGFLEREHEKRSDYLGEKENS